MSKKKKKIEHEKYQEPKPESDENRNALTTFPKKSDMKEAREKIFNKIAYGMTAERQEDRLNEMSTLLPALQPKDEAEALILGQYLALQDSGMRCLRLANLPNQGFYHVEKLLMLAHKLFNTANQTMQTALKYRSGGKQTVQVVHVHNEGQTLVAQNLSASSKEEGVQKKNQN